VTRPACDCAECQELCSIFPGWLTPRGLRNLARHLGVEVPALFRTHLALDAWHRFAEPDVLIPIPRHEGARPGEKVRRRIPSFFAIASGLVGDVSACGLLVEGRCSIHAAKPRECADSYGDRCGTAARLGLDPAGREIHERIARMWMRPGVQTWLDAQLRAAGLDPEALHENDDGDPLSMIASFLGMLDDDEGRA
jgi:hypothetical protein